MVDKAIVDGALGSAIELSDAVFSVGANDFLIRGFVESSEERSLSWKFIIRYEERKRNIVLTFEASPIASSKQG